MTDNNTLDRSDIVEHIRRAEQAKKEKRDKTRKLVVYPEVTISAATETSVTDRESSPARLQIYYEGRKPVISASDADISCASLGEASLLERLNNLLGTSHELTTPSMSSLLQSCIDAQYDFGTAYSRLRPGWFTGLMNIEEQGRLEAEDSKRRQHVLTNNRIRIAMPPRRVWDLYSNRVVPYRFILEEPWVISHDRMAEKHRRNVETAINGKEWLVPIPQNANLDLIRIELLNLGAEYVWLDVLCLRQKNGRRDDTHAESETDMPTITNVFRWAEIEVHYLGGLGMVSGMKMMNSTSGDRCWFDRAWRSEENSGHEITVNDPPTDTSRAVNEEHVTSIAPKQQEVSPRWGGDRHSIFNALTLMQRRVLINPVHRIASLTYLLQLRELPAYYEAQTEEDAWTALVDVVKDAHRGEMLFLYPEPGSGSKSWRPSWMQVMTRALPSVDGGSLQVEVHHHEETGVDSYNGTRVDSGLVHGLASDTDQHGSPRPGMLTIEDNTGTMNSFKVIATHSYPIPNGAYTLLGSEPQDGIGPQHWVIGRRRADGKFEKLSVFAMTDKEEIEKLKNLGFAYMSETILA